MHHLKAHWHHYTALISLVLAGILVGAGGATAVAHTFRGGYRPAPLPPPIRIQGGPLPSTWSLAKYTVRIHNQGNTGSCVGQTLSTLEEIAHARHGHRWPYSPGYIWNQLNGGNPDAGTTYEAAFSILTAQGDAGLPQFPADGANDPYSQPGARARANAAHYRFASWHSIAAGDTYTMKAELHRGHALAVAIPVDDSLYNQFGDTSTPYISSQSGSFDFYHSITGIAYSSFGIEIQNSWGPTWGGHGRAWLSWSFLSNNAAEIVVSDPGIKSPKPRKPIAKPKPKPKKKPTPKKHPAPPPPPAVPSKQTTAGPRPPAPPPPPGAITTCTTSTHVYHPQRLRTLSPCKTASGQVVAVLAEPYDGDTHIWLKPDPASTALLNPKNLYRGIPALVLEISPACPTTPPNHAAAAVCPHATLRAPAAGQHLTASGPWVTDTQHGWNELHPLTAIAIAGSGRKTPLPHFHGPPPHLDD